MFWRFIAITLLCLGFLSACKDYQMAELDYKHISKAYRLGPGDSLRVLVFGQKELSDKFSVDATGRISIPLVGRIKVFGRTTQQVEYSIKSKLRSENIVNDPQVSIEVIGYRPYYILGEVKNPGNYSFQVGMTFEKAIAAAGGYTLHARKREFIVSRMINNELVKFKVTPDHLVHPGDSITVSERWL